MPVCTEVSLSWMLLAEAVSRAVNARDRVGEEPGREALRLGSAACVDTPSSPEGAVVKYVEVEWREGRRGVLFCVASFKEATSIAPIARLSDLTPG